MDIEIRAKEVCVYAHLVKGEVVYIGVGTLDRAFNTRSRPASWKTLTNGGYVVSLLAWFANRAEALAEEKNLIKKFKPVCNLVFNGFVSPSVIGNTWNIGRKHTAEARAKISAIQRASWETTERRAGKRRPTRPIKDLETGVVYISLRNASQQTGACMSSISQSINGHRKVTRFVRLERENV